MYIKTVPSWIVFLLAFGWTTFWLLLYARSGERLKWTVTVLPLLLAVLLFLFVSGCKTMTEPEWPLIHPADVPSSALEKTVWDEDPTAIDALFAQGMWSLPDGSRIPGEDHTIYFSDGTEMPLFLFFGEPHLPTLYDVRGNGAVSTNDGCEILEFMGLPTLVFCPDQPVRDAWRRYGKTRDESFRIINTRRTVNRYEIRVRGE